MTDPTKAAETPQTADAREADDIGERPDRGRTPDSIVERLTGTDTGSDTRAGSLQGGAATGSDDDPDQDEINETLASEGMAGKAAAGADGDESGKD